LIDDIEYNTEREHLIIPEYGRHVQKMVNFAKTRETKEERNKVANAIIAVMGNLQPHLRDVPDFQSERPQVLEYPQNFPKYRFYGNNIKTMIDVCNTWEEGELKDALKFTIANHMKKCFLNWNKDTVEDDVIFNHLFELSDGKINLKGSEEALTESTVLIKNSNKKKYNNNNNKNKNNKNKNKKNHSNRKKRY